MPTSNDTSAIQLSLFDVLIEIPLTQGKSTFVDLEDADLSLLRWHCNHSGYAVRQERKHGPCILLHRVILERMLGHSLSKGDIGDHKDCNSLNNSRSNLRLATPSQNSINRRLTSQNTSGYKGVCWHKLNRKWVAKIRIDGKQKTLGNFDTPEEAYAVYCEAALKYHGEFARLK